MATGLYIWSASADISDYFGSELFLMVCWNDLSTLIRAPLFVQLFSNSLCSCIFELILCSHVRTQFAFSKFGRAEATIMVWICPIQDQDCCIAWMCTFLVCICFDETTNRLHHRGSDRKSTCKNEFGLIEEAIKRTKGQR